MNKHVALMSDALHSSKPSLRSLMDRSRKSLKHRHERRKIREVLRLTDWLEEA